MFNKLVQDIFAKSALVTSEVTQGGIQFMLEKGEHSKLGAMYIAIGAVTGSLQVLASLVGNSDGKDHSAQCVTADSVLMSALLVVHATQNVAPSASNPDAVGIDTEFSPESFYEAMEAFKKITGRDADSVVDAALAKHVREEHAKGATAADDLLNAICANHKPA